MKLKEKLDRVFSEFIRRRDSDKNGFIKCYCCGKILHWKKAQNMHFIPRQHMATRFSETNCHSGCIRCNYYNNGNIEEYAIHLKKDYGENIIEELTLAKHRSVKISEAEYRIFIKYYQEKIKEYERI